MLEDMFSARSAVLFEDEVTVDRHHGEEGGVKLACENMMRIKSDLEFRVCCYI